jgi:hypothetical protein
MGEATEHHGQIVSSHFHIDHLAAKDARDVLRRAVQDSAHGPVWLFWDNEEVAAIVTVAEGDAALAARG